MIGQNVRVPEQTLGDIWAQVAACKMLEERLQPLLRDTDLDALYASRTIRRGEGSIGGAWATGMPVLSENLKLDETIPASLASAAGLNQIVALPLIDNALLKAVLAWYL